MRNNMEHTDCCSAAIEEHIKTQKFQSDKIDKLIPALIKTQLDLEKPQKSKMGNRGSYSDLEDYLNCCIKVLAKNNILLYQHPRFDGQNRIMHSMLIHSSGQWITSTDLCNPDPKLKNSLPYQQAISTVFTYAKRRMIQSQLGLGCDEEDIGE